ncbi:MAG TPA: MFS transporter [Pilimelia sp.]|nr:MFS transporter [Pilimelia sp.]
MATWFTQIPLVQQRADLSPGRLSLVLIAPTVGALFSMQVGAALVARIGSRLLLRVAGAALPVTLSGIATAGSFWSAVVAFLVLGLIVGLVDVSMNAQGIAVERAAGRPVMNGLHGAWGLGAIVGASISTGAFALHLSPLTHAALVVTALVLCALAAGRHLLRVPRDPPAAAAAERRVRAEAGWFRGWTRRTLVLGVIGAAVMLSEGAVSNWVGILLRDHQSTSTALAAAGYTVFTAAETAARFAGDRVQQRIGVERLVRGSAALFCGGMLLLLLAPVPWASIAGLALVGVGIAPMNPAALSAVGSESASARSDGTAVARFTTLSYAGILAGPPIIGGLAELVGLPLALSFLMVPLLMIGVGARIFVHRPAAPPADLRPDADPSPSGVDVAPGHRRQ